METVTAIAVQTWESLSIEEETGIVVQNFDSKGAGNGNGVTYSSVPNQTERIMLEQMNAYNYAFQRGLRNIVTPTICCLGCAGNIVNLIVLTHIRLRKTDGAKDNGSHLGLIMLAISDLLFCITLFPRAFVPEHESLFETYDIYLFYQLYGTGIVTTFILTSTWLTVVMALLRYIGICHPFASRRFDGPFFAKILYPVVFVLCILLNVPIYFQYTATIVNFDGKDTYLIDIGLFDDKQPLGRAYVVFRGLIGIGVPTVILLFCNCSLIKALRSSYKMRRRCHVQESASSTSNRLTLTLIVIIISFVVLVVPCETMDFFSDFIRTNAQRTEIFLVVRSITNLCQIMNFAFNFVLYCIINVHFRSVVFDLIRCRGILASGPCAKASRSRMRNYSIATSTTQHLALTTELSLPLQRIAK